MPTETSAGRTGPGSRPWGASAASATDGLGLFTTMSQATASILFPSLLMRSFLFLAGESSDMTAQEPLPKIGTTSKLHITSAISGRATGYRASGQHSPSQHGISRMEIGDSLAGVGREAPQGAEASPHRSSADLPPDESEKNEGWSKWAILGQYSKFL